MPTADWRVPPLCPICEKPVPLEHAKADEHGHAIHEDCYVLKLQLEAASSANGKHLPALRKPLRRVALPSPENWQIRGH
jgi:hypothetical protein